MDAMSLLAHRIDSSLLAELEEVTGSRPHVLAWGRGPGVLVVATREQLALRSGEAWRTWGWQEILSGSWRAERGVLRWVCADGGKVEAGLDSVGRLPEAFRERIQASTVVTETHDLAQGTVAIIGRRTLDGSDAMTWYASASGGASLADPATAEFVVRRTDALKEEWG